MHMAHNSSITIFFSISPYLTFSCLDNNFAATDSIKMKLHVFKDLDEKKWHAQGT